MWFLSFDGSACPLLEECHYVFLVIPLALLKEYAVLSVEQRAVAIIDKQHGETKTRGMAGKAVESLIHQSAARDIDMDIHIVGVDELPDLLISRYERRKPKAPRTPVAAELTDKILAFLASLLDALVYLLYRVERLVIDLLHGR